MDREAIYIALFNKISAVADFKIASRRLRIWNQISPPDKPCLFMRQKEDTYDQQRSRPSKITLNVEIYIYTDAGLDPNTIPATQMNTILDDIDTALSPDNLVDHVQTLGGLVSHCWIDGPILTDTGELDGDGIAVIPIKILTTI